MARTMDTGKEEEMAEVFVEFQKQAQSSNHYFVMICCDFSSYQFCLTIKISER